MKRQIIFTTSVAIIIALSIGLSVYYLPPEIGSSTSLSQTRSAINNTSLVSNTSMASCSGYPPGGNCLSVYNFSFTTSIQYYGSWRVTYHGYHSVGCPNSPSTSGNYTAGSYTGNGNDSRTMILSGENNNGLTLIVVAQKLDNSSSTLTLILNSYSKSTSISYGSTFLCSSVAP